MKKLLGLLFLIVGFASAQDLDSLAIDTVEKEPPAYYGGLYLMLEANFGPNPAGLNLSSGIGIGIQYEKWILGFSQFNFEGTIEEFIVFPNAFQLDYRRAGPLVGYQWHKSDWFSNSIYLSYQWGDMVWSERESQEDFLRDKFNLISIAATVELNRFRYTKPYFMVGYQRVNNLTLTQVDSDDFTGFFFGLGIRMGYFNQ